eukprot:4443905-Alexandrium_andersonii.AAC.1
MEHIEAFFAVRELVRQGRGPTLGAFPDGRSVTADDAALASGPELMGAAARAALPGLGSTPSGT